MMYMTEIKNRNEAVEVLPVKPSYRMISAQRRKLRNRVLLQRTVFAVVVLALVLLGIFLLSPSVQAKAESANEYETRIISVQVQENDSLWTIAERFYCSEKESITDYINDIKRTNHLTGDTIYPDTYLVIRYYIRK